MSAAATTLRQWAPNVAIVAGSGFSDMFSTANIQEELAYAELGWPQTAVPGHANALRLMRGPIKADGGKIRLAVACGRPHYYEGWSEQELARPLHDLAAAGVRRVLAVNACGGLRGAPLGGVVVCDAIVDLQHAPREAAPERRRLMSAAQAQSVAAALAASAGDGKPLTSTVGAYVAVSGPQYETPAECEWLSSHGLVVGMSGAPEARAAQRLTLDYILLGAVVNEAAVIDSHPDVVVASNRLTTRLAARLAAAVTARWPELG